MSYAKRAKLRMKGNVASVSLKRNPEEVVNSVCDPIIGPSLELPSHPAAPAHDPFGSPGDSPPEGFVGIDDIQDDEEEWFECQEDGPKEPFDSIREAITSFYTSHAAAVHGQVSALPQAERAALADGMRRCRCQDPGCGGDTEAIGASPVTVCVLTMSSCHHIQLPKLRCKQCLLHFYPNALQLGCMPGNVNAWHLRLPGVPILWFHIGLLQQIDSLMWHAKLAAMWSTAKALLAAWELLQPLAAYEQQQQVTSDDGRQCCTPPLRALAEACLFLSVQETSAKPQLDQLRRQLGDALREYQYLDTHARTLVEQLKGWPLGPQEPCAACAGYRKQHGYMHTLQFDCCFKLVLYCWRRYVLRYPAPANRRLFADNAEVQEFEATAQDYLKQPGKWHCRHSLAIYQWPMVESA